MRLDVPLALISLLASVHFGCSPAAPAESPQSTGEPESNAEQSSQSQEEPATEPESQTEPAQSKPKSTKVLDDRVPHDRSLTNNDCNVLGKQFASAIKADLMLEVPAKLKGEQRDQVVENIEQVARKKGSDWTESCQTSLVGQVVDEAAIKCAAKAPTVKEFDACLNSTVDTPPKK